MQRFRPKISLPPAYAQLSRVWCSPLRFAYRGNECFFRIGGCQTFTKGAILSFTWEQNVIYFLAPEDGLCEFLEPNLTNFDLNLLGDELRCLFLESFCEDILEIFSQFHETLKFNESHWSVQAVQNALYFDLYNTQKNLYRLYIAADNTDLATKFMEKIYRKNGHSEALVGSGCVFPFRLITGQARLSFDEIQSLRISDIILSQTSSGFVKFSYGKSAFFAEKQGQQFRVTGLLMKENDNDLPVGIMPDDDTELSQLELSNEVDKEVLTNTDTSTLQIGQLPVTITFEAGKKEITFEQLQQIHEGYTFELDQKPDEQVQMIANGHCIGQGEWVQINDHLGIRITHLFLK
jgi:type III secretion system YscQ/HrcQ family protein